ncbi:MAG: hypothetical protein J6Z25_03030 [Opitutales bacterium]|nr:hypothetical protein [Opitutales bacterium]
MIRFRPSWYLLLMVLVPSLANGWYCRVCQKEHTDICTQMPWPTPYNRKSPKKYLREWEKDQDRLEIEMERESKNNQPSATYSKRKEIKRL